MPIRASRQRPSQRLSRPSGRARAGQQAPARRGRVGARVRAHARRPDGAHRHHEKTLRAKESMADDIDRTLILVKPDAFARGLTGEIIARFERKGLRIAALRHMTVERDLAERHYAEHAQRPFFGELVAFITSGPLVAMVLEGTDAVKAARQVIGATNPLEAASGSIRGDFAIEMGANMVHGSDSPESAAREAALFFPVPGLRGDL